MVFSFGTWASTVMVLSPILRSTTRSISWKYSSCIGGGRALGGNQFVDAIAQVFQDEILFGGGLAVVDFLGPLFQRHLDPERLVDGEGDVEKVEAVDAQLLDGVAFRRDRVARDVAGFGDNGGDLIECSRHH